MKHKHKWEYGVGINDSVFGVFGCPKIKRCVKCGKKVVVRKKFKSGDKLMGIPVYVDENPNQLKQ